VLSVCPLVQGRQPHAHPCPCAHTVPCQPQSRARHPGGDRNPFGTASPAWGTAGCADARPGSLAAGLVNQLQRNQWNGRWPFLSQLGAGPALLPLRACHGAALVRSWGSGLPRAGPSQTPAYLEMVKRPKTRGFWGSRVRRRKTSSAKRGVEMKCPGGGAQVQRMQAGVLDAMPTALGCPGRSGRGGAALLLAVEQAVRSPSWSKWVSVPWGPGMEHTRRALRNVLQRLMRLRFPPTSFCRAPRAGLSPASPSLPHRRALLSPHRGTPAALSSLLCRGAVLITPCLVLAPAWEVLWPRGGKSPPSGTPGHSRPAFGD